MVARIPVAVLGATGVVGQRFVARLADHPRLALAELAASDANVGKRYDEACAWRLEAHSGATSHAGFGAMLLRAARPEAVRSPIVFSALDSAAAADLEPYFARAGRWVFSNASAFRMEPDVPLVIPEINPEHLGLVDTQRAARGWKGAIVCNTNCTAAVLAMSLAPLERAFGVREVLATSFQAVSGAGYPGVSALDVLGNVIPFVRDEEEKLGQETRKLLGRLEGGAVIEADLRVSAACHRVAVVDGHTLAVSVRLQGDPSPEAVREVLASWRGEPQSLGLPSAPPSPIVVHDAPDRPQVRRDVDRDRGMSVQVGRVRRCEVLGIKYVALGHNAERGAAGASILNAELAIARGLLE